MPVERMSREQARTIFPGISKSCLEANPSGLTSTQRDIIKDITGAEFPKIPAKQTKTELAFGLILAAKQSRGEIIEYAFEPFRLRYGSAAFYKPDFVARTGGKITIEQLASICEANVIDMGGEESLWQIYKAVMRAKFFTIYEVKGAHIFPEAKPRFKAAKLRHPWANFELHQKKGGEWTQLL